jgi:hypothetical protein
MSDDFSGPAAPAGAGVPEVDATVATPINTRTLFIL